MNGGVFTNRALAVFLTAALGANIAGMARAADSKPIRHLAYAFDVALSTDETDHSSGIGGEGSGVTDYRAGSGDKGTISVDVLAVQPDTGLVVRISEEARETRTAKPATCVIYGSSAPICDTSAKINEEELTLLRLLGRTFVDQGQIDANHHWQLAISSPAFSETSDFTIAGQSVGILKITGQRVSKTEGARGSRTTTNLQIDYDQNKLVPTLVKEDSVMRQSIGMGRDNRVASMTTLTLVSDSMAAPGGP